MIGCFDAVNPFTVATLRLVLKLISGVKSPCILANAAAARLGVKRAILSSLVGEASLGRANVEISALADTSADYLRHYLYKAKDGTVVTFLLPATYRRMSRP